MPGGSVTLDRERAREAIRTRVAEPLGISIEDAASGIIRLVEQHLLHAVERISVQRGFNPAGFTLVPAGGAGPLHGPSVAAMLGARRVYVPRQAGAFCAMGLLQSDVRQDYIQVFMRDLDGDVAAATQVAKAAQDGFAQLRARANEALTREGFTGDQAAYRRALDLRYRGQQSIFAWNCPMARLSIRPWCAGSSKRNMPASSAISSPAAPSRSPACAWPVSASCAARSSIGAGE